MSQVNKGYECTCSWSPCHHSHIEKRETDFDRVTAERDAMQLLLNAADDRADVLVGLLRRSRQFTIDIKGPVQLREDISAALKPAEGGGDET